MSISKKKTYEEFKKDTIGLNDKNVGATARKNGQAKYVPETNEELTLEDYQKENQELKEKLKIAKRAQNNLYFLPTALFTADREFNITYINKMAADVIKQDPAICIGKKCYNLFNTTHCNTSECRGKMAMERNCSFSGETMSGKLHIGYAALPIKDKNGNVIGIIETLSDISEQKSCIKEFAQIAEQAKKGNLSARIDFKTNLGDMQLIASSFNETLDAVIGPLNVAADYVDKISAGNIPPRITDTYYGDFNKIKDNLNKCIDAINLLVADANILSKAAVDGKLATRADASRHSGDFYNIYTGDKAVHSGYRLIKNLSI